MVASHDPGGNPGSTVSLLPLSAEVTGITYTGMLYPLDNATIASGQHARGEQ